MSSDSPLHDLASIYAVNALEDDERLEFEAHLESCDQCQAEVAAVHETMAALATETEAQPPSELRANILASISETEQLAPIADPGANAPVEAPIDLSARRTAMRRAWPLLAAAAVLVIAAASVAFLSFGGTSDDGISVDEVAAAPDAVEVDLGAAEGAPGSVNVVWSADLDVVSLTADGLADPGPGRVYELWFVLEDGAVAPAGLFTPEDGSFTGVLEVDELSAFGWGITIEPAEGSDQPTGEILYLGEL